MLAAVACLAGSGCGTDSGRPPGAAAVSTRRPIEAVLAEHTPRLMAIPGVVGTYQGASDVGKPFIGIMVASLTPKLRQQLPRELEGYPVRLDETGEIRPLGDSLP